MFFSFFFFFFSLSLSLSLFCRAGEFSCFSRTLVFKANQVETEPFGFFLGSSQKGLTLRRSDVAFCWWNRSGSEGEGPQLPRLGPRAHGFSRSPLAARGLRDGCGPQPGGRWSLGSLGGLPFGQKARFGQAKACPQRERHANKSHGLHSEIDMAHFRWEELCVLV